MLLISNILTLTLSCILTVLFVFVCRNLTLTVLGILLIFSFRAFFGEFLLSQKIRMSFFKDGILESILTASFVLSAWFLNNYIGFFVYGVIYLIYVLIYKKRLCELINMLKINMAKRK